MVLRQCLSTNSSMPLLHLHVGERNRHFKGQSVLYFNRSDEPFPFKCLSNACFPLLTVKTC